MPAVSPRLGEFLIKTTGAKDIDHALKTVFTDYLDLKLQNLRETIKAFETKWGMDFNTFKQRMKDGSLEKNSYSFDVENDFWKWEEAETLKEHYEQLKREWI
ncbi:MAG: hypothetical protein IBX72_14430 [Nitrospirae bacterium]|jgi:hypothetical protein|nr:hypothetical protein [Nitrospirota bacterium]